MTITDNMDRVEALILYQGKLYSTDRNHQDLLGEILKERGTSYREIYGFDLNNDDDSYDMNITKACVITNDLFQTDNNDILGFDLWEGDEKYLICHFKEDAKKYLQIMLDYCMSKRYHYGYYISSDSFNLII